MCVNDPDTAGSYLEAVLSFAAYVMPGAGRSGKGDMQKVANATEALNER